jgi:excisionase family DNA binding protein
MDHNDHLIDVGELARYLAVPVKTLYSWRYRKQGPRALRVGRHLRYRWSDVQQWIDQQIDQTALGPTSSCAQNDSQTTLTTDRRGRS